MKILRIILILCVGFLIQARADDRKTLFDGLGLKLVTTIDAMTDKSQCSLFVLPEYGPIYFSIEGPDKVTIWPRIDGLLFASDAEHLLRIGDATPIKLQVLPKRNGLAIETSDAAAVVKALIKGDRIRLRVVRFPSYEKTDLEPPSNFALPYVWSLATQKCGWPSLGVSTELPSAKLDIYKPDNPDSQGYVSVTVRGNGDLGIRKGFDKFGGGCDITLGSHEIFGMKAHRWISEWVDSDGRTKLVVRDKDGNILFEERVPTQYGRVGANPWPVGEQAARAMLRAAPFGSVILEDSTYKPKATLYGFKELWDWGIQNCSFPSLEK